MSEILESLSSWFSDRPKWLKLAAKQLLKIPRFSNEDIAELALLCQQEAEGKLADTSCSFPASAFSQGTTGSLRLCSISDVEGVNALAPRKPLEFGKGNITVVYGTNGSGKSGYVRLLKHVCGAREMGALHGDVFKASAVPPHAKITFQQDATTTDHEWDGLSFCDALRSVDIFDTTFGRIFTCNESEVRYEPPVLSFFSSLIDVCEKVAAALDTELSKCPSKKATMSPSIKATAEGSWYDSITATTATRDIDEHCVFDSKDEAEVKDLQQRLAEQAPAERAKKLRKISKYIDALIADAKKFIQQLSAENCRKILEGKKKVDLTKRVADATAEKVFSGSTLDGIGSDVWQELWESARRYSVAEAYKQLEYPHVQGKAQCVLCQQPLSQEAKNRLISFESYVKGEAQRAITEAENEHSAIIQGIDPIPTADSLQVRIDAAGIAAETLSAQVLEFFSQLQTRRELALSMENEETIPTVPLTAAWIANAEALSKAKIKLAEKFEEDTKSDNRVETQKKLNELLAKRWLADNRASIIDEVATLKKQSLITKAKKTTSTKGLSQKKGELAEALITNAFVSRFNSELRSLGATHIKVELVKSKVSRGRVLHKLQLRGAAQKPLADILSEGESRIVSIAAFLADVTGKANQAPFVFDDPISSLDQDFEDAVVKRLLEVSKDKQVVIFTHRLSLLGTVKQLVKDTAIVMDVKSIRSTDWGTGEPAPIPLSQADVKSALNVLIDSRWKEAKEASDRGNFETLEILEKAICSDFRILVERSIEEDLLCGVVQRFQRSISSMMIKQLAKLQSSDCNRLDSLMSRYSCFEHSQPSEAPIQLPKLDDLRSDLESLKTWREEYRKRAVVAAG